MIRLRFEEYKKIAAEKGFSIHPTFNIVGVRNRFAKTNYFDDTISVYFNFEHSIDWAAIHCPATTMPGIPSMLKPPNPDGTAILVPGQYVDCYQRGLHRGKYEALVQVRPVRVYRDSNHDVSYDRDVRTIQEGLFGINLHRASFGAKVVGVNSAGCQVIQEKEDYYDFLDLCDESGLKDLTYTLVEI